MEKISKLKIIEYVLNIYEIIIQSDLILKFWVLEFMGKDFYALNY
jgi:hypothetical protein